jgi:hypothetical protein
MPTASERYRALLMQARARGIAAGRAELQRIASALDLAQRDLRGIGTADTLTGERATGLRAEIMDVLRQLRTRLAATGEGTVAGIARDVLGMQRQAALATARDAGRNPSAAYGARFDALNRTVLQALAARRGGTARTYAALIDRNMLDAAPALDRLIEAGVARGQAHRSLANAAADLLRGKYPSGELNVPRLGGLSIEGDAKRIARSETMNTLRESNRLGLVQSGMVAGVKWQVNSAHAIEDECDDLAEADDFGLGPGYYPPDQWPLAPHPNCGCYQGDVLLLDVSEWDLSA